MALQNKIKHIFKTALGSGASPHQLALSCSTGLYIAFSPFPGLHTIMMFASTWLLRLNFPLLFLTTSFNNPWTMVPFYSGGYFFGYWFVHNICHIDPKWTISLAKVFGSGSICLWSFLLGGNILGLLSAFSSYPLFKYIFVRMAQRAATR